MYITIPVKELPDSTLLVVKEQCCHVIVLSLFTEVIFGVIQLLRTNSLKKKYKVDQDAVHCMHPDDISYQTAHMHFVPLVKFCSVQDILDRKTPHRMFQVQQGWPQVFCKTKSEAKRNILFKRNRLNIKGQRIIG